MSAAADFRFVLPLTFAMASAALLEACATAPAPRAVDLGYLNTARITRSDVEAQLGPPAATFDRDHVTTYRIDRAGGQALIVPSAHPAWRSIEWQGVTDDLVLAYDPNGKLLEYRLVSIHVQNETH